MSELKVDKITPRLGTTLTLGDSGDTINFGSGVLPNFENLTVTGDLTVDTNSLKVDSTNNFVGIGTATPSSALDIVGNIVVSGTVDGRDIATDGTKLDTIATNATANPNAIDNVVEDTTPQLGGNLDLNSNNITGTGNINITGSGTFSATTQPEINVNTSSSATSIARLNLKGYRTIADQGVLGRINFDNTRDGDTQLKIEGYATGDTTGRFEFFSGTGEVLRMSSSSTTFNQDGADIDFRVESDNNTHALFVQGSDGNIGVGTSSPSEKLQVEGNIRLLSGSYINSTTSSGNISLFGGINYPGGKIQLVGGLAGSDAGTILFSSGTGTTVSERLRITSDGLVGIGTDSPDYGVVLKDVNNTSGDTIYVAQNTSAARISGFYTLDESGNNGARLFYDNGGNNAILNLGVFGSGNGDIRFTGSAFAITSNSSSADLTLGTNSTERLRIEASGLTVFNDVGADADFRIESDTNTHAFFVNAGDNAVLISKSSSSNAVQGTYISNGFFGTTKDGGTAGFFNRLTSDGKIIDFAKDTTSIGGIGTVSGYIYLHNNSGDGIALQNNALRPSNQSGANQDNVIDLGISASRFNDGHFGGTVTANAFVGDGSALTGVGGGGKVGQVVSTTKTDTFSTTSTSFTDITGMSVSITPSATSSKILVIVNLSHGGAQNIYSHAKLLRGTTSIAEGNTGSSNQTEATFPLQLPNDSASSYKVQSSSINYLDSPSSTSALTYKVQVSAINFNGGGAEFRLNRPVQNDNNAGIGLYVSTITVMEILA